MTSVTRRACRVVVVVVAVVLSDVASSEAQSVKNTGVHVSIGLGVLVPQMALPPALTSWGVDQGQLAVTPLLSAEISSRQEWSGVSRYARLVLGATRVHWLSDGVGGPEGLVSSAAVGIRRHFKLRKGNQIFARVGVGVQLYSLTRYCVYFSGRDCEGGYGANHIDLRAEVALGAEFEIGGSTYFAEVGSDTSQFETYYGKRPQLNGLLLVGIKL